MSAFFAVGAARAQTSDTWRFASPGSDYNDASNWVSNTVPDNGGTATFGNASIRTITINSAVSPGGFTFNSGAPAYTLNLGGFIAVSLTGAGIVNNSSSSQTINIVDVDLSFNNSATAGSSSISLNATGGSTIEFNNNSTAGSAHISADGSPQVNFNDTSTAGSATFTITNGGFLCFCDSATAGSANITISGSNSTLQLNDGTSLGSATVTNNTNGLVQILGNVNGGTARYIGGGGLFDLTGSTGGFSIGSIEGSGTIDLDDENMTTGTNNLSTTFSGVIQGTGTLTKTGTGTLTLSGTNTYTGATTVSQGALMLTGSLTSNVTVNSGATFGGTGTVTGNVTNSGTVAPTNFGTLSVTGGYTQNSGGVLQVAVNSAGQSGKLAITGNATLGGTVSVQAASGTYARNTSYTILTVTGTITGAFSGVTSNFAFLKPSLSYGTNAVTLALTQSANAFASGAQSGNQRAVGAVLDQASATATGDFATVINAIAVLDTTQGPRALDAIGGQNYSGFSTVAVQGATAFMNAFASQVGGGNGGNNGRVAMLAGVDDACDIVCDTDLPRWGVWGGGIGGAGTVAGDRNSHGTSYGFGGFAAGLDYRFDPAFLAGVTVGYTSASLYTQDVPGSGHSGTVQLALYGQLTAGQIYVDGLAGYARGQNQMQRPIVIPGLAARTASSQTTVDQFFGQLETGYKIDLGGMAQAFFTPFARLQASTAMQAAFTETGADSLNLNVAGQTTNSLRSVLGAVLGGTIGKATTKFRLGWSHEFADTARPVTASFAGAPALSFTTTGAAAPREGAVLGLSVDAPLAEQTSLYARYDAELAGGNTSHVFSAGVRYVW